MNVSFITKVIKENDFMKRIILCIFVLSCVMGSFSLNVVAETEESAKIISNWKRVLVGEPFTNNDAILKISFWIKKRIYKIMC